MVLCMSRTRRAFERRAIGHSSEEGYGALHARSKEGRKEGMLSLSQWSERWSQMFYRRRVAWNLDLTSAQDCYAVNEVGRYSPLLL